MKDASRWCPQRNSRHMATPPRDCAWRSRGQPAGVGTHLNGPSGPVSRSSGWDASRSPLPSEQRRGAGRIRPRRESVLAHELVEDSGLDAPHEGRCWRGDEIGFGDAPRKRPAEPEPRGVDTLTREQRRSLIRARRSHRLSRKRHLPGRDLPNLRVAGNRRNTDSNWRKRCCLVVRRSRLPKSMRE